MKCQELEIFIGDVELDGNEFPIFLSFQKIIFYFKDNFVNLSQGEI